MSTPSPRLATGSLLAGAGVIAATTLVSRVVGLGRWFVFSHSVGATCVGQVYATANQVPNVLYEVAAGGALAAVAVPLVAGHLNRGDEAAADRTASALLTWALTLLVPLAVLVVLLAEPIAAALIGGQPTCEPSSALRTGALMLAVFAPQVVLYGVGIVLAGVLQAHRRFLAAAVAPLLSSLVVIAAYLAYGTLRGPGSGTPDTGSEAIQVLAWGTTAGVVALSLPLLVPAWRAGVRLRPTWTFPAGTARRAGALALAGLVAVGAQQVCVLVTVWLANRADGVGVVNVYTYVQTIYLLPYAVLVVPLAVAAFPRLTDATVAGETLRRTAQAVLVAGIAAAVALVAVRREVGVLFLSLDDGADDGGRAALEALPVALTAFAPGLVGFGLAALLTRALYARGRPRAAATSVAAGWLLAAVLPVLYLAGGGASPARTLVVLGAASTAGMTLTALLQTAQVRRAWGPGTFSEVSRPAGTTAVAALAVLLARELLGLWWEPAGPGWALVVGLVTGLLVLAAAADAVRLVAPGTYRRVRSGLLRRSRTD